MCRGDFGRLGHDDCSDVFLPRRIEGLSGRGVSSIACGDTHTLAVMQSGALLAFGRNQNGQLGTGTQQDSLRAVPVEGLAGERVLGAACGAEHSTCVTESGKVFGWGWGRYGNLGIGTCEDACAPLPSCTQSTAVRSTRCILRRCVLRPRGSLPAMFTVCPTMKGISPRQPRARWRSVCRAVPAQMKGLEGVHAKFVACGWRHSLIIDQVGLLFSCGWSKYGQLGHGDNETLTQPKVVEHLRGQPVRPSSCSTPTSKCLL